MSTTALNVVDLFSGAVPGVHDHALVPLEPELEHQILAIAARTGASRAEVIQECVRDRLTGGVFAPPLPFAVKHPAGSRGGGDHRPEQRAEITHAR